MWPLLAIIFAAVGSAAALLVAGVSLAVSIERRRHRTMMQQHGLSRGLSYHRANLSANENNYAHIPQPNSHPRRNGRPERIPTAWNTVPSEESITPEDPPQEHPESTNLMPPAAKRQKGLQSFLYGHSFNVPKTRRQKKIQKAILMKQMPKFPLSAITEFTDSTTIPAVELQTSITPNGTPERTPSPFQPLCIAKTRPAKPVSQDETVGDTCRPSLIRSVSMASSLTAPVEPLPPLPMFNIYKGVKRDDPRWRTSTTSLDTVGSSVLGTVLSSPSRVGTDLAVPSVDNSGIQSFDFGFEESRSAARLGIPPGRQTMQRNCSGKVGVSSIRPSLEYLASRVTSLELAHTRNRAGEATLKTNDASTWSYDFGFQTQPRLANNPTRHSLQDYESILGKRSHLNDHADKSPQPLRRPASVATGNPYQWDRKPTFSAIGHSACSNDVKKGHKRQNCMVITNLPILEPRRSRVEQMPGVEEEQPETPSASLVKIPGLTLLEAEVPVLRARASLADVKGSPSPLHNRPTLVPTRPKRPLFYRTSSSSTGLLRPDSDIFSTGGPDLRTPENFRQSNRQWPLSPTPVNHIKLNSATPPSQTVQASYDSPILPSPISGANVWPRKSLVKGPRNPPPGLSSRTASPSPVGNKQPQKHAPDDLRKSIMALRSMNSEGRLLDPSSRVYRAVGDNDTSASPTMTSLNKFPAERRYGSAVFGTRGKLSIAMSPSARSIGGASIWEDASVRGDSPEPELPTVPSPVLAQPQPQTPKPGILYPDLEAYENMQTPTWKDIDRYTSPPWKGLGLRVGNARLGTPGSLYDRDGFLRD
jgi:hypothetical protein